MASGRYTRIDARGKSSSNYCSTIVVVVIVAACLVGAWITMSSSVDPAGYVGMSVGKDAKQNKVSEKSSREFEDNSGDLPEDGLKGNIEQASERDESGSKLQENGSVGQESENSGESGQEEKPEKSGSDEDERVDANKEKEVESVKDEDVKSAEEDSNTGGDETTEKIQQESEENNDDSKIKTDEAEEKSGSEESSEGAKEKMDDSKLKTDESEDKSGSEESSEGAKEKIDEVKDETDSQSQEQVSTESESKDKAELLDETSTQTGAWSTQKAESEKQKVSEKSSDSSSEDQKAYKWKLCNVTAGPDYIPCLDNIQAIKRLPSTGHYEHRERHCPEEAPTCLVPLPEGYKTSVRWPKSREKIWFANVPHLKLAEVKGHQNWVQASGEYITFPGGGTQFVHGATRYIDFIEKTLPDIAWGKRSRVVLDVGCGVASFGGFLFDKDVLTLSLAPKDEHEAQVQFALERGIPAISAVMGTKRLPFPSNAFDIVHCARCRVPWHAEGGKLLLELNRVLRPGSYFVWSATPVYRKDEENVAIWKAMSKLTKSMCWELLKIGKDTVNGVSAAIYRKPMSNDCYESRMRSEPPLCQESDNPNAAWDIPMEACLHKVPTDPLERGSQLPAKWPSRLDKTPYWLKDSETGVYGKAAPKDFTADSKHWKRVVADSYMDGIGIDWSSMRNVMDMRAIYGGFAAALKDLKLWVMNVVPVTSPDTLPVIYERGLFGIYHNWCESFNTYPRTYDLLHADHLFSDLKKRCNLKGVIAEVDRILRPEGSLIVRDNAETIAEVESMAKSLQWKIKFTFSKDNEGLLSVRKTRWRPSEVETIRSAIA
ncbi:probable methyltransferase PMT24 [Chenopodium quinoa]|uniref:Methyltransferase PMT26 n=1 Tax=Chenopodium quinoa TaxID=63459 RepID=A0A803LHK9_CHEQI|nr:probable methyltransferase PMT24 [Chenopodium quinoa]